MVWRAVCIAKLTQHHERVMAILLHDRRAENLRGTKTDVYDRGTNSERQTATGPFSEAYRGKDRIAQVLRVSGRERAHRTLTRNAREVRLGSRRTAPPPFS